MIYTVTYKNAEGQTVKEATFSATDIVDAMEILVSTPSLEPTTDTVDVDIRCLREPPTSAA